MTDQEIFGRLEGAGRHLLSQHPGLTPIQRLSIPAILDQRRVLLVAPTATGKTEAALCPVLSLHSAQRWSGRPAILYVAPTRALVNDIFRRLEAPLRGYVTVGRRTGEHDRADADVVITTPESLDSMLARGRRRPTGHHLQDVRAVLLDELHLLADNARGAQLNILLNRLEAVTRRPVLRVALSATVSNSADVARRFLGPAAEVLTSGGGRSFRVQRETGDGPLPERPSSGVDPLALELWCHGKESSGRRMAEHLLKARSAGDPLKALVFVPSRSRCDSLAAELRDRLESQSPVGVVAHHGSLAQPQRERAEQLLQSARESVAVATSTLEIGIDIGDIRTVVLDGPPGSVSALLQRAGRANRRENQVHLMPFASSLSGACILASMIRAATDGQLDEESPARHLSVAIQQLASSFFQSDRSRLTRGQLKAVWESEFGPRAADVIEELVAVGTLTEHENGLGPSEFIGKMMDRPLQLHANIGSSGRMIPVVDALTGQAVAWVPRQTAPAAVSIAGRSFVAKWTDDAIELSSPTSSSGAQGLRYAAARAPVLRSALRHLGLGLGLGETPLVREDGKWVHFGGALFGEMLNLIGCASDNMASIEDPRKFDPSKLQVALEKNWATVEPLCGFGPYHRDLPVPLRKSAVLDSLPLAGFQRWIGALQLVELDSSQRAILFPVR